MRQIPTLIDLKDNISNDLKSKLNISDTDLKVVLDTVSGVLAAQFKLSYLFLSDIQKNIFPDTAESEQYGGSLERIGRLYLKRDPFTSSIGKFNVRVIGVSGSVLRSGLTFKSNENSKNPSQLFILNGAYTLVGSNDSIVIESTLGGIGFDLNVGDQLTITEPVIGVNNIVTVLSVIEQPKAGEDLEDYRQKIIDSIQLEPQGGAKTDYMLWSEDAQGVRRVYPYVKSTDAGTIQVFVEATITDSIDGFGTPTQTIINDVESVLNFDPDTSKPTHARGRRPMQATLEMLPITLIPIDVTIVGLNINTSQEQLSIKNNIEVYLYDIRPYIDGADLPRYKNDILYAARLQSVATESLDTSNFFNGFDMIVNGSQLSSYNFSLGEVPYLRNIIFS